MDIQAILFKKSAPKSYIKQTLEKYNLTPIKVHITDNFIRY